MSVGIVPGSAPGHGTSVSSYLFTKSSPGCRIPYPVYNVVLPSNGTAVQLTFTVHDRTLVFSSVFIVCEPRPFYSLAPFLASDVPFFIIGAGEVTTLPFFQFINLFL